MSDGIEDLKHRLLNAETDRDYYMSLVESFFTGQPKINGIDHIVMAQWGRKRLEEKQKNKTAVLLAKPD